MELSEFELLGFYCICQAMLDDTIFVDPVVENFCCYVATHYLLYESCGCTSFDAESFHISTLKAMFVLNEQLLYIDQI